MQRKLTISIDQEVYEGLYTVVGRRHISRFLNELARAHVTSEGLSASYAAMAGDGTREGEALEWSEGVITDVADERR